MLKKKACTIDDLPDPLSGKTGWPWTIGSAAPSPSEQHCGSWPSICIVTPSFNQADYIEETIRSVLLQGYPRLEYIIMDGGSDDGSMEIIRKYEPWYHCLRIGPDDGQAAAIAEGFERSNAEIMAWLNSDDRYEPGALFRVACFFIRHPRVVFLTSNIYDIDPEGNVIPNGEFEYIASPCRTLTANLGWHTWPQPGTFWRRWAYERCGSIDRTLKFCMDKDLFLRLTALGPARRLKGPPTAAFRYHERSKTATIQRVHEEEYNLMLHRYGHPWLIRQRALLQLWRRAWLLPSRVRRHFGGRYVLAR